jgi:ubiquinone/menaquinone biosynthesis C-methylase UbiE
MKWSAMDCTRLSFPDESFDVVIEKATIDAMLTTEKSPWRISHQNKSRISLVLREVCRVLKPIKGQFISISFFGPHFRFPLYKSCFEKTPKLSMEAIYELEKNFHYYCYRLVKSLELNEVKSLVPNEVKTLEPNEVKPLEPNEVKPFLYQPPKVITSQTIDHFVDDNNHSNDDHNYIFNINI